MGIETYLEKGRKRNCKVAGDRGVQLTSDDTRLTVHKNLQEGEWINIYHSEASIRIIHKKPFHTRVNILYVASDTVLVNTVCARCVTLYIISLNDEKSSLLSSRTEEENEA